MVSQSDNEVSQKLKALREKFLKRAREDIRELSTYAEQTRSGTLSAEALIRCYQSLHRLAGSAGTFGLPKLGQEARLLEKKLKSQAEQLGDTPEVHRQSIEVPEDFADGIDTLAELVEVKAESSGNPAAKQTTLVAENRIDGSHGMQVRILLIDADASGAVGSLSAELARYGFICQFVDERDEKALKTAVSKSGSAASVLCRDSILPTIMPLVISQRGEGSRRRLPVVAIGDDDTFDNNYLVAKAGASAFFSAPINVPELAERIESLAIERSSGVNGRVLIVEDDIELAEHYCLVLRSAGIEAEPLTRPDRLMAELSAFQPDIVLMDVQIGAYSGVNLARLIRFESRWLSLPIIYLSSEDDRDNQLEALSQGADEFLVKPVSDDYLVRSVRIRCYRARQLSDLMNRDSLTGLLKHSLIKQELEKELARCRRFGHASSVVMIDLDHFKQVNDTWGHRQGDIVIRALANLLRNRLRETDIIGRYGGEEFAVVLPDCSVQAAMAVIKGIGESFSELAFSVGDSAFHVTLSAGVSEINDFVNGDDALEAADQALYHRKREGRNGVTIYRPD
ncbi:diguanylate cyclase [Marinobacter sp. BW6]|uniref:diguanylate cyclase n=1 Tax=Marinobacter sp. BW6 TaxID=2592624 RepID=UPI0011DE9D8F|nr:diguanylate cyclase [Marinobacter sp. BW6]TYC57049.1 diguanylate cyclase [Marinobacter sp. BW6]